MDRNIGERKGFPDYLGLDGPMTLYDNFPKRIRALLQSASFNYAIGDVDIYLRERGEEFTFNWLKNGDEINIRNVARATYGPDHPQAG